MQILSPISGGHLRFASLLLIKIFVPAKLPWPAAKKNRVQYYLSWAEPTFHYPSSSSLNSSTTTAASEVPRPATPGKKRKERQDETTNYPFTSNRFNYPRQPTEEELQALLDFTDTWFPSSKRKCTDMDGDDNN